MREIVISQGWQLKPREPSQVGQRAKAAEFSEETGWIAAQVPGTAYEALWQAGRIGSPYNHATLSGAAWIHESDFLYRCRFDLPPDFRVEDGQAVQLLCEGLDTVATVWLNGIEILHSDNMFVPHRITLPESGMLRRRDNDLWLLFQAPLRSAQAVEAIHGKRPVWNGDTSRVYLRKAQYQFGWDFSPTVLTAGPWQPIRLQITRARLSDVSCPLSVAADLRTARLALAVEIEAASESADPYEVVAQLYAPDGTLLGERSYPLLATPQGTVHDVFDIDEPALWWPRGHGEQPLYTLKVELYWAAMEGLRRLCDRRELRLGARRLRLVEERLPDGENFYFEINNRPIFCGGANWIPADVLPTRVSKERYARLLDEAVAGELTMLRVWGGGIYETDAFYDLCDERGLLIWQDFGFACGLYPALPEFQESVAREATSAVKRLRHHPSLVIWAGNNEDYSIAQSVGVYAGPSEPIPDPGPSSLTAPRFDGRALYEGVLPTVCETHDPSRPYWRGSPYSRHHVDSGAPSEGDRHIWDVWHGAMRDYQDYGALIGRFASEFGMQAVPERSVVEPALAPEAVDPVTLRRLNYGQDGPERIGKYIERNLPVTPHPGTDGYLYLSQVNQAEAMAYAVRIFRRRFDADRRCSGALVWQLDDCWPSVSWSLLGYCNEGETPRRKPSFYSVRRELMPWVLGLSPVAGGTGVEVWVVAPDRQSDELGDAPLSIRLRAFRPDGTLHGQQEQPCQLVGNQSNELGVVLGEPTDGPLIYGAQLVATTESGEQVLARAVLWPQPLKNLLAEAALRDPGLQLRRDGDRVELRVQRPAKAVLVRATDDRVLGWSDNLVDLLPDEPLTLEAPGSAGVALSVRSLFVGGA